MDKPIKLNKLVNEMYASYQRFNFPWNYRINIGENPPEELEKKETRFQQRLSSSSIVTKCKRKTFYRYHQVAASKFTGKNLALFNLGHAMEKMALAQLHACGFSPMEFDPVVYREKGEWKQFSFTAMNNRVVAKPDGILPRGVLGHEKKSLLELKSMNIKHFQTLKNDGVQSSEPSYYSQMQLCMALSKIPYTVFISTCKNDSAIYAELVKYDRDEAKELSRLCRKILDNPTLLPPKSDDWCYNCDFRYVCKGGAVLKRCRTCKHYGWYDNTCGLTGKDCGYCDGCSDKWEELKLIEGKW